MCEPCTCASACTALASHIVIEHKQAVLHLFYMSHCQSVVVSAATSWQGGRQD